MITSETDILKEVESFRRSATKAFDSTLRRERGQFLTPLPIAVFMASLLGKPREHVFLIDAGGGTGMLSVATILNYLNHVIPPKTINVTTYEVDNTLSSFLTRSYELCHEECQRRQVKFEWRIIEGDFVEKAVEMLNDDFFTPNMSRFNVAIVNPPYSKIRSDSRARRLLRSVGIETSNLYATFLALLARLLDVGGELVSITPRSFSSGPYFRSFRREFFDQLSLRRIHLFESRSAAFKDDEVLQENVIIHGVKSQDHPTEVMISTSKGVPDKNMTFRQCQYNEVLIPHDRDRVLHLTADETQANSCRLMCTMSTNLRDLGLEVSTGRVVDFRARDYIHQDPSGGTAPLIYPCHFDGQYVTWPRTQGRKPNAIADNQSTADLLIPSEIYVLVKRFSAKEEPRRIVACVYDPHRIPAKSVGFENHLNYFHAHGKGLPKLLAMGLAAYLNSATVDAFFRRFNGHTQVNASDLRRLPYPTRDKLEELGENITNGMSCEDVDNYIEKEAI